VIERHGIASWGLAAMQNFPADRLPAILARHSNRHRAVQGGSRVSDIFISYARATADIAAQIGEALRAVGYTVWRDDELPAHRAYSDVIQAELDAAKAVLVIWSADAAQSEWVRSEADRARAGRKLVQITVDGAGLPMPFDQIQCADLKGWDGSANAPGWRTMLASLAALTGSAPDPDIAAATGRPARKTGLLLAVLPFDNLSADPEMQFFSDGVSEEIIQRLSRGSRLKVVGRTSSFQFRGDRKGEAARSLNCSHVLDGSIRRAASRVRVSAHLLEVATNTTLWSDRYDGSLEDIFAVQDEISASISAALDATFSSFSTRSVDPAMYDLYLRASPRSFAPDDLRTRIGLLEVATQREAQFTEAWGRLAYLRAWLRFYQPFADRPASAAQVMAESTRALALDPQNLEALTARLFIVPPFGDFAEGDASLEAVRRVPGSGLWGGYVGWYLRTMGRMEESLEATEQAYRLDSLDPMTTNMLALARMAVGRVAEAVPLYEDLVERVPDMSFPVASLLRAYAFLEDWPSVDRLLAIAERRQLREFEEGLLFIHAKRDPSTGNIAAWMSGVREQFARTGSVDIARLVYSAHLGLVDEAFQLAETARLGPSGSKGDVMGPDGYRTSLLFQASMPELRDDPRFVRLCARLGLVAFWAQSGKWPDCAAQVPYDFQAECALVRDIPGEDFGFPTPA